MKSEMKDRDRRELDDTVKAFQLARKGAAAQRGWLHGIRKATGIPVSAVARQMGTKENRIYRMEAAEAKGRIQIATLQKGARALGCELVYAVIPIRGTVDDLAAEQRAVVEQRRKEALEARKEARAKRFLEMDGPALLRKFLRATLRKQGVRVRTKPKSLSLAGFRVKLPAELEAAYRYAGRDHSGRE